MRLTHNPEPHDPEPRDPEPHEQCVTTMTGQIKDQGTLIDQLRARLAAAPTLGSRPKNSLSLPTLLSLLCILAAIVVLYLFLAVEPPAVVPI